MALNLLTFLPWFLPVGAIVAADSAVVKSEGNYPAKLTTTPIENGEWLELSTPSEGHFS